MTRATPLLCMLALTACGEKDGVDSAADDSAADDSAADDSAADDSAADDSAADDSAADDSAADLCAEAVVTFADADGAETDLTAALLSGAYTTLDSPGTLSVCPGTWYARLLLRADVAVVGLGAVPEDTILSGGESGTILDVSGEGLLVTVENLTLDRGAGLDVEHNSGGGGLYCEEFATVDIERVRFTNNFANDGPGLYAQDCDVAIRDTVFQDNLAEDDGGALTLWFSTGTLADVVIADNVGLDGGGAAFFYSEVSASGLEVRDNTSGNFGGGVWVYESNLVLSDSVISGNDNSAGTQGGGLLVQGSADLDNVSFSGNSAPKGGGLFVYYYGAVEGDLCDFSGNSPEDIWVADFSEAGGQALSAGEDFSFSCAENACAAR